MTQRNKAIKHSFRRYSPSPIPEVQEVTSTSIDTTANTIKPLQVFQYLPLRRKSYAFQLLKQFILFSSQNEDSLEQENQEYIGHKDKHFNNQTAQSSISSIFSVVKRVKQKIMLSAYDKLKKRFFRKKMVYRNKEYVDKIVSSIANIIKDQHKQVLQFVFIELIHNLKVCRAKETLQNQSKSIPSHFQYEDKNFKPRQVYPFHIDQHSGIFKNQTEQFFQSDSRIQIAKDFGIKKYGYISQETPKKQFKFSQTLLTTRQRDTKRDDSQRKQNIFFIQSGDRSSSQIKGRIKKYIKIPVQTKNINIIQISSSDTDKNSRNEYKKSINVSQKNRKQKQNCSQCDYCKKFKLRQQNLLKLKLS